MDDSTHFPSGEYIRGRMKMRYLLQIVAIDDLRSINKAASALHITQPAATKLLADIEGLVGVRLFDRTTRGITPTTYGDTLIQHARSILASLDTACEDMSALRAGSKGTIRVGSIMAGAAVLLPRSIARLKESHPYLSVSISCGMIESLVSELRAGSLDLVLGRISPDRDSEGVRYETLLDEPMRVVARAGHRLSKKKNLALTDLASVPWIWPSAGALYRLRLEAAFRQAGVNPPADLVESDCPVSDRTLLRETDRIGVVPETVAHYLEEGGGLISLPVSVPMPSGPLGIITAESRTLSAGAQAMIAAIRDVAGEARAMRRAQASPLEASEAASL
ncbi:MAG: LysR family transcriptional regulator [Candidatus Protistobacter heckmanni]|nr:LysR family transcriptional regulator [Candidatus Protistobacter heckmanni]